MITAGVFALTLASCGAYNSSQLEKDGTSTEEAPRTYALSQYDYNNINRAHIVTELPEEIPVQGDVLVVVAQHGDTLILGYPHRGAQVAQPEPEEAQEGPQIDLGRFPNWQAADEEVGADARLTDDWCEIAAQHACNLKACPFTGQLDFTAGCGNCRPGDDCHKLDSLHFSQPTWAYDQAHEVLFGSR